MEDKEPVKYCDCCGCSNLGKNDSWCIAGPLYRGESALPFTTTELDVSFKDKDSKINLTLCRFCRSYYSDKFFTNLVQGFESKELWDKVKGHLPSSIVLPTLSNTPSSKPIV